MDPTATMRDGRMMGKIGMHTAATRHRCLGHRQFRSTEQLLLEMRNECTAGARRVGEQVAQHRLNGRVVITVKLAANPDGGHHQARR